MRGYYGEGEVSFHFDYQLHFETKKMTRSGPSLKLHESSKMNICNKKLIRYIRRQLFALTLIACINTLLPFSTSLTKKKITIFEDHLVKGETRPLIQAPVSKDYVVAQKLKML